MEGRNRHAMRATRETVGMTVEAVARATWSPATGRCLAPDTVSAIERSDRSYEVSKATDAVWQTLDAAKERQDEAMDEALDVIDAMLDALPEGAARVVELRYWNSEREYLERATDTRLGVSGDWRMANANARRLAAILESEGVEVRWTGMPLPTA